MEESTIPAQSKDSLVSHSLLRAAFADRTLAAYLWRSPARRLGQSARKCFWPEAPLRRKRERVNGARRALRGGGITWTCETDPRVHALNVWLQILGLCCPPPAEGIVHTLTPAPLLILLQNALGIVLCYSRKGD